MGILGIGLLGLIFGAGGFASGQEDPVDARVRSAGQLPRDLGEASGVAVSRRFPGTVWIHNDSGHGPWVYAARLNGEVTARFSVVGAQSVDWEDIAVGPCLSLGDGESCLYVADTGNNDRRRVEQSIFVFPEPDPVAASRQTEPAREIRFKPVRGPTDIEALAVDRSGDVLMFSKGTSGTIEIFRILHADLRIAAESGQTIFIRSTGQLPVGPVRNLAQLVTGAAWSPEGTLLAVRTYQSIHFFHIAGGELQPARPSCRIGSLEAQGEAVDFNEAGGFVVASEAVNRGSAMLYVVDC